MNVIITYSILTDIFSVYDSYRKNKIMKSTDSIDLFLTDVRSFEIKLHNNNVFTFFAVQFLLYGDDIYVG